jgi:outer membrane protein assembly factor BamB
MAVVCQAKGSTVRGKYGVYGRFMTFLIRLFVLGAVAAVLSGCWPTPGAGPDRRNFNPYELILGPENVERLTQRFRAPLPEGAGPPVATTSGLFVRTGLSIAAFEPGSGAHRWTERLPPDETGPYEPDMGDPFVIDSRRQVVATYAMFYASHIRDDRRVTLSADTGARQESGYSGQLHSMRGSEVALLHHQQCCGMGEVTSIIVGGSPGGGYWGGAAYLFGGRLSLGVGQLFVASRDAFHAYDTTTPCPPYSDDDPFILCLSQWTRSVGSAVTPVVIGDGTVYAGSQSGHVHAADARTGFGWSAALGSPVNSAPALADDVLFVGTADGRLTALPAGGCGDVACPVLWTSRTGSGVLVQPAVAGGVVFIGSADGTVAAFDAAGCGAPTCQPLWSTNAGAPVTGGLAVFAGRLYVGTQNSLVSYGLPPG